MKKTTTLITLLITFVYWGSHSQTEKGNIYLGLDGALSLGQLNQKRKSDIADESTVKTFSFSVAPEVGYFIIENLVSGLNVQYSNFSSTIFNSFGAGDESKTKSNRILFNGFTRYYFHMGKVLPFIEGFVGLGSSNDSSGFADYTYKTKLFNYGGAAGIAIPLGTKVTFDTSLNLSYTDRELSANNISNNNETIRNIRFFTGFSVYLN